MSEWYAAHRGEVTLVALWVLASSINLLLRWKTAEGWVAFAETYPRMAALIRIWRATFGDPVKAIRAVQQAAVAKSIAAGGPPPLAMHVMVVPLTPSAPIDPAFAVVLLPPENAPESAGGTGPAAAPAAPETVVIALAVGTAPSDAAGPVEPAPRATRPDRDRS